ncbi:MAG: AAA family ATPase [Patescibacteria group bacterium]
MTERSRQFERTLRWGRIAPPRAVRILRLGAGLLALAALAALFIIQYSRPALGLTLIGGAIFAAAGAWRRFFAWYKNPPLGLDLAVAAKRAGEMSAEDLFSLFDFNARALLYRLAKAGQLSPTGILQAFARSYLASFFLERTGISREDLIRAVTPRLPEPPLDEAARRELFGRALALAAEAGHEFIRPADLLRALDATVPEFASTLREAKLKAEDLEQLYRWEANRIAHRRRRLADTLGFRRGIGKRWSYGYTPFLDRFAGELAASSHLEALHIEAHGREVRALEDALSKTAGANAILVGEPGVGARTTVLGLSARLNEGRSVRELNYLRVLDLKMDILLSQPRESILEFLGRLLREAESAGNVILVLDNIHLYLAEPGRGPNVIEVLLPYLKGATVRFIGLTTPAGYRRAVLLNPFLGSLFEKIDIREPDRATMIRILTDYVAHREARLRVRVQYQAITAVVDLAGRYLPDRHFPEKGLELMESIMVAVAHGRGARVVDAKYVGEFVQSQLAVPVGEVDERERQVLLNLEGLIHERVMDQEEAVGAIANALRRARAGVASTEKPIGTFLFLGPTGVGKTETAKAVAEAYFGTRGTMIRLDMSEYQKADALDRLIGSQDGREVGQLASQIREHPFSLVLLDEIEKAHPSIHQLFLQILDEGRATDVFGRKIDFRNTIVIGTSNAGAEFIRQALAARTDYETLRRSLIEHILQSEVFRPEFLNRFDAVVVFRPLDRETVRAVVSKLLRELALRLREENYLFDVTPELVEWIASGGYSEAFGGRELKRFIQDRIESVLATGILEGRYPKGAMIRLSPQDLTPPQPNGTVAPSGR